MDVFNERYRPDGTSAEGAYTFPYADHSFDFVFATSVFTHLRSDVTSAYLHEIGRVLRPNGRLFATFFLTNAATRPSATTVPVLSFPVTGQGYRSVTRRTPEVAIGYDEENVRAMMAASGLQPLDIRYGTWAGGAGLSFQDILVASPED